MLPAEGYLTERMAKLRTKAHRIRNGHIARLKETRHVFSKLPVSARKKAAANMAEGFSKLVGIDTRLQRLDRSVAENEKRIRDLTQKASQYSADYDHKKLVDCLKQAEKLQKHNSQIFKIIERTENKLTAIAKKIASEAKK
jgi:chromosome segregation ATPase